MKKADTEKKSEVVPEKSEIKSSTSSKKSFNRRQILIWAVAGLVLLVALGTGVYYYLQYQKAQQLLQNPAQRTQVESSELIEKIGSLIELPKDEQPTIATVSDVLKLKAQPFFAKAQNGDKVLIYEKAKKAVLYRPSTNKIIEFGPVNIGTSAQDSGSPTATPAPVTAVLYNGAGKSGAAAQAEVELKEEAPNVTVSSKGNAKRSDYEKTIVIDLTGNRKAEAEQIASILNGEIGQFPAGETKPENTDILVILGTP